MVTLEAGPASTGAPESPALEAIGLIAPPLHAEVRRAMRGLRVTLDLSGAAELVTARIESKCPDVVLIDTDLVGCPAELCRFARSLRPDVRVFGLAYYWSDREESLRACVDAVLHKPARDAEWRAVLRACGVLDARRLISAEYEAKENSS